MTRSVFISWVKCFALIACTCSFSLGAAEKPASDSSLFDVHVSSVEIAYSKMKYKSFGYHVGLELLLKGTDMQICSAGKGTSFKSNLKGDHPKNNMFMNTLSSDARALSITIDGNVVPPNNQKVILYGILTIPVAKSTSKVVLGEVPVDNTSKKFMIQGMECTLSAAPSASSKNSMGSASEGIDVTLTYPQNLNVKSFDFELDGVAVSAQSTSTMRVNQTVTKEYQIPKTGKKLQVSGTVFDDLIGLPSLAQRREGNKIQVSGVIFDAAREVKVPVKVEFSASVPEIIATSEASPFNKIVSSIEVKYPSKIPNAPSNSDATGYTLGIALALKNPEYSLCRSNQEDGTFKSNFPDDNTHNNSFFNEFSENGKGFNTKIDVNTTPVKNQKVCVTGTLPVVMANATKKMAPIDLPLSGTDTIMIQGVPCSVSVEQKKVSLFFNQSDVDGFEVTLTYPKTLNVKSFDFSIDGVVVEKAANSSTAHLMNTYMKTFVVPKVGKKLQIGATLYDGIRKCSEPVNVEFQIDGTAKAVRLKRK